MFESYLFPISYAFLSFPIAAALFTLPFLIVQYRRHGYINKYRSFLLYLFLLYLMNALFLVILPLPATLHNDPPNVSSYMQLVPFHFIDDIIRETGVKPESPSTYLHLLKERAFLQVLFNVILFIPFGIFLRYYFRFRWVTCLFASFGLSIFFEITQVTGIYWVFDYPYRLFDVDDLLMNTIGGMIGFVAAEWLSVLLPRIDKLDENTDLTKKRISYTRRSLAFLLDWVILLPVLAVVAVFKIPYGYATLIVGYFIVVPYVTNGLTFGKWIVRIRLKGQGERINVRELVIRYGLLYLPAGVLNVPLFSYWPPALLRLYTLAILLFYAALAFNLLRCVFNRNRRPFYETKSGTNHVITLAKLNQKTSSVNFIHEGKVNRDSDQSGNQVF
ncbi:VanZ family protein [Cohnella silvisoli]|uniref:VanZ family protein n=1 Tax=Cohnella silvisoli TaxID=2873699 RepID=A0ABV1L4C6_9BACL|nr:VanZ family protein [Cohnella silvisoli]MCD9026168.1 VanZ family protein [Cohnella silvisoli]